MEKKDERKKKKVEEQNRVVGRVPLLEEYLARGPPPTNAR